jgi:cereblon
MSRIRRLVSQSTFHDDELDNEVNNYPQDIRINANEIEEGEEEEENNDENSSEASERLFEEYVNMREEAAQSSQSQFDCELPIQHSYLGETEHVRGFSFFEPGKIYEIAVCSHHSLIFPGEILPMIMLADAFFSRMTEDEGLTFGLIFQADTHEEPIYGVTCTVYERGVDNNGHITVKSRAHQRFVVVKNEDGELTTRRNQTFYAKVKILPEILLPDPIRINLSYSMMRHIDSAPQLNKIHTFLAASSHWPKFVFDQFSVVKGKIFLLYDWKINMIYFFL